MSNEKNIFEVATRNKLRFAFRGVLSVEDLWDLQLKDLDSVFKVLNSELKQVQEESLLDTKTQEDEILDTKIQIVKYIVDIKLKEQELKAKAKELKEQKQKILGLIASKDDEEMRSKSSDELKKLLAELEN